MILLPSGVINDDDDDSGVGQQVPSPPAARFGGAL